MLRCKSYEPDQSMLIPVDTRVLFPLGSFERFVVDIVRQIDISIFDECEDDRGGESRYDPRAMLGILFYGFCRGVFSSRRLSKACTTDMGFMYVSGFAAPEHSTICRFLSSRPEALRRILAQVLYLADKAGFVDFRLIAIDGTKIKANASMHLCATIEEFEKKKARLEHQIQNALEKQRQTEDHSENEYLARKRERYQRAWQQVRDFLQNAEAQYGADGKQRQQNMVDPQARLLKSKGRYLCGYNAQLGVDQHSGLIVAADIIDESNDKHALPFVVEQIKRLIPQAEQRLCHSAYLADNGYYSGENMAYAREQDLEVYIADRPAEALYGEHGRDNSRRRVIGTHDCRIYLDGQQQVHLQCPGGARIADYSLLHKNGRRIYRFRVGTNRSECSSCRLYHSCVGKTKAKKKEFEVDAAYIDCHEYIEAHRRKLHSATGRMIYAKRMSTIERVFGDIKENRGVRSFLRRGLENVRAEWTLTVLGFNIMRLWKLGMQFS